MKMTNVEPAFGEADLSNCDRELIQFAGSVQPYGVLLVLDAASPIVLQASANTESMLGVAVEKLLGRTIGDLGGDLYAQVRRRIFDGVAATPLPFRAFTAGNGERRGFEALIHRTGDDAMILELVPADLLQTVAQAREKSQALVAAVARLGAVTSLDDLSTTAVKIFREFAGYDRVMFYRFDPDGHGEVIAEDKRDDLEPFLGLHYPESDIPRRARELYQRNRVRVLADVDCEAVPLIPRLFPPNGAELDMSMSLLRSMSPLHLQYLRNMGVTATLVASLVREDSLWGLIACHHYSPRRIGYPVRAACELIAEIVAARLAVLENLTRANSDALVQRLEDRLIEATTTTGAWQHALMKDSADLLRAVGATGVFLVHEDELLTAGEVPQPAVLRSLADWIASQPMDDGLFASASVAREVREFASLAATAAGVLAVELSRPYREYIVWLRGEQLREVRWAGDPHKPVLPGNDPRELSPRRSFAVWTEKVQLTSRPWARPELATARAIGMALRDVALQVRSMSYLITEDRLTQLRLALQGASDGVLIADGKGRIRFGNEAFSRFFRRPHAHLADLGDLPPLFRDPPTARAMIRALLEERQSWRGELLLDAGVPLAVRADVIPRLDGCGAFGYIVLVTDMSARHAAVATRHRVQRAIHDAQRPRGVRRVTGGETVDARELMAAVLASASLAVMEVAGETSGSAVVPTLDALEASARRAAELALRMIDYADGE